MKNFKSIDQFEGLGPIPTDAYYNLVTFNSYSDINKLIIKTDADFYGGDTYADVNYNIKDDAGNLTYKNTFTVVISGNFEMKNKHLIEQDIMIVKVYFKVILY